MDNEPELEPEPESRLFSVKTQSIIEQLCVILWSHFDEKVTFSPDQILSLYKSYENANIRSGYEANKWIKKWVKDQEKEKEKELS